MTQRVEPSEIIPGKNYRITKRYTGGAVIAFKGRVHEVQKSMGSVVAVVHVDSSSGRRVEFDVNELVDCVIEVERTADAYPTRPGTLLRHTGEARSFVRVGNQWLETEFGGPVSWPPNDCIVIA